LSDFAIGEFKKKGREWYKRRKERAESRHGWKETRKEQEAKIDHKGKRGVGGPGPGTESRDSDWEKQGRARGHVDISTQAFRELHPREENWVKFLGLNWGGWGGILLSERRKGK